MRAAFVKSLVDLAAEDERIVLLTGDLGFTVIEPFAERFPDRFFNAGVAEQNMVGMATGLAEAGLIPFVYSIATFATLRPYEFVRNGPVLHDLPVRIVGVGGGFDYGHNGMTHYALEDVAIMRAQPAMGVVAPADAAQAQTALMATWDRPGPLYYRLGKQSQSVEGLDGRFEPGRLQLIGSGEDVAIVALGSLAAEAVEAAEALGRSGISATVAVLASVSPEPVDDLIELLENRPLVLTAEAHYATGGAGSLVAEVIADHGLDTRLVRHAVREVPRGTTGDIEYLYDAHGLSAAKLAAAAERSVQAVNG